MYHQPVIGITCSKTPNNGKAVQVMNDAYIKHIIDLGGIPILLSPALLDSEDCDFIFDLLDGVLLTDSDGHINPEIYGAEPCNEDCFHDEDRTNLAFGLIEYCLLSEKPLLAMGLGMQELNVYFGGTLPAPTSRDKEGSPKSRDIYVVPDGLLAECAEPKFQLLCKQNRLLGEVAPGMRIEALDVNNMVESISYSKQNFMFGVQWGAEYCNDNIPISLFPFNQLIKNTKIMDLNNTNESIGNRISALRLAKGYSQRKLAQFAGLTNTAISSIEHGRVSPSINTLSAILKVLDTNLAEFFTTLDQYSEAKVVVREEELVDIGDDSVSLKLVHNHQPNRKIGFLIEEYQPHSQTGEKAGREGEEVGTVLSGKVTIYHGNETYHLTEGDSYVIDTAIPHVFANEHNEICRIVSSHTATSH